MAIDPQQIQPNIINGQPYNYLNMNAGDYIWNQPGKLAPITQNITNGINVDQSALDKNRQEAMRTGPSAWRGLEQNTINQNQVTGQNQAAATAAGQEAQGEANLAMRGGLSGGARERLQRDSGNNYLNMSQDIADKSRQAGYSADTQDESNRETALHAQPGLEVANSAPELAKAQMNLGANQFDISNDTSSFDKLNYANANKYNQQMQAWASGQQANATQNSGKK